MSSVKIGKCPFCKQESKTWLAHPEGALAGFDCEICGQYFISGDLFNTIMDREIDARLLNCISENIKSNTPRGKFPIVTSWHKGTDNPPKLGSEVVVKRYEDFAFMSIIHANKTSELLLLLATKISSELPFQKVKFNLRDLYRLKIFDMTELFAWNKELERQGLISLVNMVAKGLDSLQYSITPLGWMEVQNKQLSLSSKKVFVAMQFNWEDGLQSLKTKYVEAVKAACRDCGYEAELVDDKHHIDQITDRIVANIKSSKFVVADFTYNNRGAYYEAGFARGLSIPVIHTVMKGHASDESDKNKKLHFDIKQINYIEWESPEDLRSRLRDRIKAVIE